MFVTTDELRRLIRRADECYMPRPFKLMLGLDIELQADAIELLNDEGVIVEKHYDAPSGCMNLGPSP